MKTETIEKNGKVYQIDTTGKVRLRDGRTGEEFDSPVTIGIHALPETRIIW